MSKVLDINLSREVANKITSKAQNCFDNAYTALMVEGAIYVLIR